MSYNNYYYYTNGEMLISNRYFYLEDTLMIANLAFQNDNVDHVYTVSRETGEIINILQK